MKGKTMVFRTIKAENPFIQIDKTSVYDSNLSWKAKGLLLYLLSRPDNWEFYLSEVLQHATDGKSSVAAGIKELEEHRYLVRERQRQDDGKYSSMVYLVYEKPQNVASMAFNAYTRKPHVGKPYVGKSATSKKDCSNIDSSNIEKELTSSLPKADTYKDIKDRLKNVWNKNCGTLYKVRTMTGSRSGLVIRAIKAFPDQIDAMLEIATKYVATNGFYQENGYGFDNCIRNLESNYEKGLAAGMDEKEEDVPEQYKQMAKNLAKWKAIRDSS